VMVNHHTTEVFFDDLEIPADNLIGEEGRGFRYILDGMNAERVLTAAEAIGNARWFIRTATAYANDRRVFDRPIGQNQSIQFPIAQAYIQMEAADLMVRRAAAMFEAGVPCGAEANMARYLAAECVWNAAEACMQTHGGYGFAREFNIERKWREARLSRIAPVSTNLILAHVAQHVLGLPRSY
jgi:acyl-CoA dehydrogenase